MSAGTTQTQDDPHRRDRDSSAEDLGEDVLALASVADSQRPASVLRRVNGRLVRLIVEAA
ncbi:MAG TPA: hypothetical protein VLZ77_13490 [Acidimicrobiales bacterium]|nr:hypothetical protein [Acidimicrobiales bacterium]